MEIRRSYDRLIATMGFPILIRWHLYIESGPCGFWDFILLSHCDLLISFWQTMCCTGSMFWIHDFGRVEGCNGNVTLVFQPTVVVKMFFVCHRKWPWKPKFCKHDMWLKIMETVQCQLSSNICYLDSCSHTHYVTHPITCQNQLFNLSLSLVMVKVTFFHLLK